MVKKDKAATAAAKKQRALLKTAKKGNKKNKKLNALATADDADQDIDSILADYQARQAERRVITESSCPPPSTRINASFTASPIKPELFLFGGEFFDGNLATFYNELFIYSISKNTWVKNTSPNSPLPRSSHQAVVHKNEVFLFGGEFSSPKQNTFYHYGDFWSLDCGTRAWTKIDVKPSPSARSGHRMCSVGRYILLFGGFQDTSESTRYLSDLWCFDTDTYEWLELKPTVQAPEARSGCIFCPGNKDEVILYGGYCTKKLSGTQRKGVILNDYWTLKMQGEPKSWTWAKRKRPTSAPSQRIGAATALHKHRLILFGGVFDIREGEETLESTFYNDLHCLSIESGRWFPLKVRPPRKTPKQVIEKKSNRDDDLLAIEKALQIQMGETDEPGDEIVEMEDLTLTDIETSMTMPHPRFNAAIAVWSDICFIYSGVFEQGEKEYTLNDLYSIDLAKLDGVRQIFGTPMVVESDSSEEEEESDDGDEEEEPVSVFYENLPPEPVGVEEQDEEVPIDPRPRPKPFEPLRTYFSRTLPGWESYLLPWHQTSIPKELRTQSWIRAENHWWSLREIIRTEEDELIDAGMDAIEEITKEGDKGLVGRRR